MTVSATGWVRYTYSQVLLSQRVYWHDIAFALTGALVPFGLSLAYVVSQRGSGTTAGFDNAAFLLPGFMGFVLFYVIVNVINSTASRRDALIYKRLRGTALPDTAILGGEAISGSLPSVAQALVLAAVGIAVLHAPFPDHPIVVLVALLLGALAFAVLAVGISGLLPSAEVSTWLVMPLIFLMMFSSGLFFPIAQLPAWLQEPVQFLPSSAVVGILRTGYLGLDLASNPASSLAPHAVDLLGTIHACAMPFGVLCAWIGIGIGMSQGLFRWDPRHAH